MNDYLDVCIEAVKAAGEICRKIQAQLVSEDTLVKKDRSPVTVADFASQAKICSILRRHFPDIPVVGEEDTRDLIKKENRDLLERIADQVPGWSTHDIISAIEWGTGEPGPIFFTLDPIDGTKGFLRGEQYAVALALIRDGIVALGVLACPNLDVFGPGSTGSIVYAERGKGAFGWSMAGGNRERLSVSPADGNSTVRFLTSVESGHSNHGRQSDIMAAFGERRQSIQMDSQAKYAMLARGDAEVYLRLPSPKTPDYREKIWDHAAGSIIVQEAGGRVTDIDGRELDFNAGRKLVNNTGIIGSNGRLHDTILDEL